MPTLTITKAYANGQLLYEANLDNFKTALETLLNTTLLDSTNVQVGGLIGSNLANGTVTSTQLGTGSIGTAQIVDNAVTPSKLSAYVSASSTTDNHSVTYTGVTTQSLGTTPSVSISGVRPVLVYFKPSPTDNLCYFNPSQTGDKLQFTSSDSGMNQYVYLFDSTSSVPCLSPGSCYFGIYFPTAAANVTFTVNWITSSTSNSLQMSGVVSVLEL